MPNKALQPGVCLALSEAQPSNSLSYEFLNREHAAVKQREELSVRKRFFVVFAGPSSVAQVV